MPTPKARQRKQLAPARRCPSVRPAAHRFDPCKLLAGAERAFASDGFEGRQDRGGRYAAEGRHTARAFYANFEERRSVSSTMLGEETKRSIAGLVRPSPKIGEENPADVRLAGMCRGRRGHRQHLVADDYVLERDVPRVQAVLPAVHPAMKAQSSDARCRRGHSRP